MNRWLEYRRAREAGEPVPDEILVYFDEVAERVFELEQAEGPDAWRTLTARNYKHVFGLKQTRATLSSVRIFLEAEMMVIFGLENSFRAALIKLRGEDAYPLLNLDYKLIRKQEGDRWDNLVQEYVLLRSHGMKY